MTEESLGSAALYVTINTDGVDAGKAKLVRSTEDIRRASKSASDSVEQNSKRQVASLEKQIAMLGKSRDEQIRWNIEQRTSGKVADELRAKLDKQVATLKQGGAALNQYGLSAKQTAAALRGVPAQVTDLVTSLASGQRPLTVLLQQGGQLKDMFGGIVPAAKALGSSLLGLVNPYTVAAAAAAVMFLGWKQGSDEAVGFRQAIALTGDAAGTTAESLQGMAVALSQGAATQHEAAAALAEVAKEGKFTAEQIELVSAAAIDMERATGQAISETVKEFSALKDDPVKAILELNEKYHFLTLATYEQIKSLEEQGRVEEATNLAIRTSSAELSKRAKEVVSNAGYMERAWHSLGSVVRQVWDDIRDAGRASSAATDAQLKIASANSALNSLANVTRVGLAAGRKFTAQDIDGIKRETARLIAIKAAAAKAIANDPGIIAAEKKDSQRRAREAAFAFEEEAKSYRTSLEKLRDQKKAAEGRVAEQLENARAIGDKKSIASIEESGRKIQAALDKQIKDAEEREAKKKRKPKGDGGVGNAQSRAALAEFKNAMSEQLNALDNAKKLIEERFKSGAVSVRDYFAELKRIAQESTDVQLKAINDQIAALQSRKVAGKDAINVEREIAKLQSDAVKVQADASAQLEVLNLRERREIDEKAQAIREYTRALNKSNEALKADGESRVLAIKMGRREFEVRSAINQVLQEQAEKMEDLALRLQAKEISTDVYEEELKALNKWAEERTKIIQGAFKDEDKARADWQNGARAAIQDFITDTADIAGQTYDIFRNGINGLSDLLTDFITTGKASWKDYFDDLARQITKFIINQQLSKWLQTTQKQIGQVQQGGGAQASGGATGGGWASLFGTILGMFGGGSANGNVFDVGQKVEKFATGGVVSSPTMFGMSGKRFGLMGEAGPEAIMPLERGRDGRLGVRMHGDGGGNTYAPVLHQTFVVQGTPDNRTREQMARSSGREAARGIARTGR